MRHRSAPPSDTLPTATAIALAVLVALAATLSDSGTRTDPASDGSVASRWAASGRAVATVLSTVAERLEDEWAVDTTRVRAGGGDTQDVALPSHELDRRERDARADSATVAALSAGRDDHAHPLVRHVRLSTALPPPCA